MSSQQPKSRTDRGLLGAPAQEVNAEVGPATSQPAEGEPDTSASSPAVEPCLASDVEPTDLAGRGEVDLLRFQAFAVSDEMRRELLEAKLPLAASEQLLDTRPPRAGASGVEPGFASSVSAVDRSAATQPDWGGPPTGFVTEQPKDRLLAGRAVTQQEAYHASAPTLPTVRRQRLRKRRLLAGGLSLVVSAMAAGFWLHSQAEPGSESGSRVSQTKDRSAAEAQAPSRRIAGNRPAPHPDRKPRVLPVTGAGDSAASGQRLEASERPSALRRGEVERAPTSLSSPGSAAGHVSPGTQLAKKRAAAENDSRPGAGQVRTSSAAEPGLRETPVQPKRAPSASQSEKRFDPEELIF